MEKDKLNFTFWDSGSVNSSYQLEEGLERELIKRDLLHLSLDLASGKYNDHYEHAEMARYPILVCDGWYPHFEKVFDSLVVPNAVMIETESLTLTSGKKYELYSRMEKFSAKCIKVFTHCEQDVDDYFGLKAEFLPIFIDTDLYRERAPIESDQILLAGNLYPGRAEVFHRFERSRIITRANTFYRQSAYLQSIDHATLISRWKYIWAPPTQSRTFGAKWLQGAACNRLVFLERTELCPIVQSMILDRVHAVYYDDPDELPGLREYYNAHPEEYAEITASALALVRSRFTTKRAMDQIISSLKRDGILDEVNTVKGDHTHA